MYDKPEKECSNEMLPDFLVVGPPRTGTTWLHNLLSTHPSVFLPTGKQVHFFDKHFDKGSNWYKQHYQNASPGTIKGEINPDYISSGQTLRRIHHTLPDVKLIMIYRDPTERAFSHFKLRRRNNKGEDKSFSDSFARDPYLQKNSLYAHHLISILRHFDSRQILILDFDAMVQKPKEMLTELAAFIGVREDTSTIDIVAEPASKSLPKARFLIIERLMILIAWLSKLILRYMGSNNLYSWAERRFSDYKKWNSDTHVVADGTLSDEMLVIIEDEIQEFREIIKREKITFWTI